MNNRRLERKQEVTKFAFLDTNSGRSTKWIMFPLIRMKETAEPCCIQKCKLLAIVLPRISAPVGARHYVQGFRAKHSLSLCISERSHVYMA